MTSTRSSTAVAANALPSRLAAVLRVLDLATGVGVGLMLLCLWMAQPLATAWALHSRRPAAPPARPTHTGRAPQHGAHPRFMLALGRTTEQDFHC